MTDHITAAIVHGEAYRPPRALVEYDADAANTRPIHLMVGDGMSMCDARLTPAEATALAEGLIAAVLGFDGDPQPLVEHPTPVAPEQGVE